MRYTTDVQVAGRRRELEQIGRLLDRAELGAGGVLVIVGPAGSGKTEMVEAAAQEARRRGLEVLRASPAGGQPGRLVWAQLLRDTGAPDGLAAGLVADDAGPLDLDSAARHLVSGSARLIVVDDVDRGGPDAVEVLAVLAARCAAAATAVIATAATPLGLGPELRLGGLSEQDLAAALGGLNAEAGRALWMASRGLPGIARQLAHELAELEEHDDPQAAGAGLGAVQQAADLLRLAAATCDKRVSCVPQPRRPLFVIPPCPPAIRLPRPDGQDPCSSGQNLLNRAVLNRETRSVLSVG